VAKRYNVIITNEAEDDLKQLYAFIATDSGHHRAEGYINRILDTLQGLDTSRCAEPRVTIFDRA
jgi:plasmid stabilization system protein ParE